MRSDNATIGPLEGTGFETGVFYMFSFTGRALPDCMHRAVMMVASNYYFLQL